MDRRVQTEDEATEGENMTCKLCGNPMREQETSFCACDASPPVRFENVPAHVCEVCGEKVFSGTAVDKIQQLAKTSANFRTVGLHVYDYNTADQPAERQSSQAVTSTERAES